MNGNLKIPNVPYFSFDNVPVSLKNQWQVAFSEVVEDGQFIGGKFVEKFEKEWAEYLGTNFCVGVANGYDALVLSLKALGIMPGDYVAVPAHTFMATWLAVSAVGAEPIGIDCDENGLIDLSILESCKINLSAVIPVHMHGQMVDMSRLMNWATENHVRVIEDCAQAHGAEIYGKKAGTWGDIGAFSFYPTKNLGGLGDAGAVTTSDNADSIH